MKGYIIRKMMVENKIKVNDIAAELGISHAAVSKVIHGRAKSARVSAAISKALNKPVSDLWPETGQ